MPMQSESDRGHVSVGLIYKIEYPNGKIYIGQDRTDDINYFGSAKSALVAADFSIMQRRSFTVCRTILWRKRNTTIKELNQMERKLIAKYRSNDPSIGYNRTRA